MSSLELQQIAGVSSAPVVFVHGISGDGHALTFPPKIVSISPTPFQKNVTVSSNIVITFDQEIRFSPFTGEAIFNIRENAINGPIKESFSIHNPVTGISPRISIGGTTLTIDPTTNFAYGKKYYLEMPNIGVAATLHLALFAGEDSYYFETPFEPMDATGGSSFQYGSYRYHIFTGSGTLQINVPSESNSGFQYLCVGGGGAGGGGSPGPSRYVGGGGGGGGVLQGTGTQLKLSAGSYTVTVGGGGANTPPGSPPSPGSYDGTPSSIKQGSNTIVEALGGGAGGGGPSPGEMIMSRVGGSGGGGSGWQSIWTSAYTGRGMDPAQDWHPETGGGRYPDPQFPSYGYRGTREHGGRRGTPGQGNNGGYASSGRADTSTRIYNGGGGGGAGGNGSNAPYPNYPWSQYNWPQYSTWPGWGSYAGDGGPGVNAPSFAPPQIPTSYMPQPSRAESGGSGYYGGGGGGGSGNTGGYNGYYFTFAGQGGPGGGGHGGGTYPRPGYGSPQRFSPETGNDWTAQTGFAMLGGGGGGGSSYPTSEGMTGRSGGSGVVMIRYLYPHVNT